MIAPAFTPTVAVLATAALLFGSGAAYSNTKSETNIPGNLNVHAAVNKAEAFSALRPDHPPGGGVPLIIVRTPGLSITIGDNGRRCYRHPAGYDYWEGRDGRFYLDERYIRYVQYDRRAYRDWDCKDRRYYKRYDKHHHHPQQHRRVHGHGKGHQHGHGHHH